MSISFYQFVLENKDVSVDNNADGQESIADVDEVVREVKKETKRKILRMGGNDNPLSDDIDTIEDTKEGVHQHHPIQGTLGLL